MGFILLTILTFSAVPLAVPPVWIATLSFIGIGGAVGIIGLAVVGVSRLVRALRG